MNWWRYCEILLPFENFSVNKIRAQPLTLVSLTCKTLLASKFYAQASKTSYLLRIQLHILLYIYTVRLIEIIILICAKHVLLFLRTRIIFERKFGCFVYVNLFMYNVFILQYYYAKVIMNFLYFNKAPKSKWIVKRKACIRSH